MDERAAPRRRQGGRAARKALRAAKIPADQAAVRAGLRGGRYKPLTENDVVRIHGAALEVLERIGVAEAIPSCVELVTAAGGRLNESGRLCFPPALVEDVVAKACRRFVLHGQDPVHDLEITGQRVHFGTAGAAVHVVDIDTGEYRESTLADLYDIARLVDSLDNIHWCLRPLVARDMTTNLDLDVNTAYAVVSGTAKPCGLSITEPDNVEPVMALFDMVAGGEGRFRERPFCHMSSCYIVPPLRFTEEACETLEAAVRAGIPEVSALGSGARGTPGRHPALLRDGLDREAGFRASALPGRRRPDVPGTRCRRPRGRPRDGRRGSARPRRQLRDRDHHPGRARRALARHGLTAPTLWSPARAKSPSKEWSG